MRAVQTSHVSFWFGVTLGIMGVNERKRKILSKAPTERTALGLVGENQKEVLPLRENPVTVLIFSCRLCRLDTFYN